MSDVAVVACLGALALIGLLPRIFFRRGRLNARWWMTASPFAVAAGGLIGSLAGVVDPALSDNARAILAWPALAAAAGGVALIRWTLHTHARPVSLWHQEDDRPDELVTRGAYARVRHPFYASFLLVLTGCALALPHPLTVAALAAAFVLLDRTAAREERRLAAAFGDSYARYVQRTGRFLPRPLGPIATGHRTSLRPPVVLVLLAAATAQPLAGQTRDEREQSLGEAMAAGSILGAYAGFAFGAAYYLTELDEPESMAILAVPVFPLLGMPVGAIAGGVMHLLGREVPVFTPFEDQPPDRIRGAISASSSREPISSLA